MLSSCILYQIEQEIKSFFKKIILTAQKFYLTAEVTFYIIGVTTIIGLCDFMRNVSFFRNAGMSW